MCFVDFVQNVDVYILRYKVSEWIQDTSVRREEIDVELRLYFHEEVDLKEI